ncbi:uncharacterized protein LOC127601471 isoform X2 [Hippocampus zosterae]|uniref:uncharacterized protein LOC127601471 isoform X2 n=1 Tax=Hippocampus zosterae TaxID=109293 RepID=UPI00223D47E7|nr:uncharacterized protein LOC127601471 isoform X2 [Hippocampus zosterae]
MWTTTMLAMWITVCFIMRGFSTTTVPPSPSTSSPGTAAGTSTNMSTVLMTTKQQPNNTGQYTTVPVSAGTNASTGANNTTGNGTTAMMTSMPTSANATSVTTGGAASKTSIPAGSGANVPGWGIALLALGALLLGLLLLMLMAMIFWCCCNRGRYNHHDDIPLYTTHSRLWTADSAPAYKDMDKDTEMTKFKRVGSAR